MTRVLVTGATGFVGRHVLSPLLERGFEVHAVGRTRATDSSARVSWHEADLLDQGATQALAHEVRATHLLHLAWYAEHGRFWNAPENLDWVAASLELLRSFRSSGGSRAVFAGTCAEYAWSADCCNEDTPLNPSTFYGVSKNALRELVEGYAGSAGMSVAWGRIFFTYGPGEQPTRVVAAVARALAAGERVECSPGEQIRDFLYVEDVASAFAALVDSSATGSFDIGSGSGVALRDLVLDLERLAGRDGLVRFSEALRRDEPQQIVADPHRLRTHLDWRPACTLEEGLERTLLWWSGRAATGNPGRGGF